MKKKRFIQECLDNLGIPDNFRGYYYIISALELMLTNGIGNYIQSFRSKLYPEIATEYNTSITAVARSFERMSEMAFNNHSDLFCQIWGTGLSRPPTITDFLVKFTRYIQNLKLC